MKQYSSVIYDLDGTLIDTRSGVKQAVVKTVEDLRLIMLPDAIIEQFVGPPMQDSFEKYYNFDKDRSLQAANLFRDNYRQYFLFEAQLYPGIIDLLAFQKSNGINIAVGTNKSHDNAVQILKHFGISIYCTYIKGADRNGVLTKAEIIKDCIKEMNAEPFETLYIGDSTYDSDGAAIANIDFLAVTYGFGFQTEADLSRIRHIGVCGTISEIKDYFRGK